MDLRIKETLETLPPLAAARGRSPSKPCKVCGNLTRFFDVTDFWKGSAYYPFGPSNIPVAYYRCDMCEFMFAPLFDDWTEEDLGSNIYNDDYLLVDGEYAEIRPQRIATRMAKFLAGFEDAHLMDYGSGAGKFAAIMRDSGFKNITSFDPFSKPVRPSGQFDIITCFEVIEHTATPVETVRDIASLLNSNGCVILGEALQPPDIDVIRCNWRYCMPRNGHISFYTDGTLALLAARAGLLFHPGNGLHALSRPVIGGFTDLADRVSLPMQSALLGAPASTDKSVGPARGWHSVESFSGVGVRWSADAELSWRIATTSSRTSVVRIRVPYIGEVRAGFAAGSQLLVDGVEATTSLSRRSIIAEVRVDGRASIEVTLRTPALLAPSALRSSADHRRLGLAIPCLGTA